MSARSTGLKASKLTLDMHVVRIARPVRQSHADVVPVPEGNAGEDARKDGERDRVREGKVGRQSQRSNLGVSSLVQRQVGIQDLVDVESACGRVIEMLSGTCEGQRALSRRRRRGTHGSKGRIVVLRVPPV